VKALAIFLFALVLHVVLIVIDPIIFGGDTIMRLLHRNDLLMGHQLPMLQILISGVTKISPDPLLVRYLMAFIGAAATLGFHWMIRDLFGDEWAVAGAVFFMTNPFFLALSTVPYQEILMLTGLVFAFHFFYTERWIGASLCLAIACLTRYEAWAACPVLMLAYILRKDRTPAGWLKAVVLFGWMPVIWILVNRGALTSPAHSVVERTLSIARMHRYADHGGVDGSRRCVPTLQESFPHRLASRGADRFRDPVPPGNSILSAWRDAGSRALCYDAGSAYSDLLRPPHRNAWSCPVAPMDDCHRSDKRCAWACWSHQDRA
jgi:hypothetical protein